MKHLKRGKCVILNHENFKDENICPPRKGSTSDANALYGCFRDLGFDVETYPDYTSKQIIKLFSESMSF
jgi:caspase 7